MDVVRSAPATADVGTVLATITDREDVELAGRAVISAGNDSANVTVSVPDSPDRLVRVEALLDAALDEVATARGPGGVVHWWVQGASEVEAGIAAARGLAPGRTLLQLRRPLPTEIPVEIGTRPFRPGVDDQAWLRLNNRAFEGHPEQGGWTEVTLARRMAEPWFDPAGFLLHERDGRLAGACWTKLHEPADGDPAMGEIYVIGVDPEFHGLGLGPQLTVAGLASIADRGITTAILYVDAANTPARKMYERLGFQPHRVDRAFTGTGPGRAQRDRGPSGRDPSQS
ncbi:MAG: mycothiol synthase [Ilumatobacteraceae bacterium]